MSALWYETLPLDARQSLYEEMRRLGFESAQLYERARSLSAPYGSLAVGGGSFDESLRAEVIAAYLRGLRKGLDPRGAKEFAAERMAECVRRWNGQRKGDFVVHRSATSESSLLERVHAAITRAVEPCLAELAELAA